jgi:branched-chain amino acid transport system permease protein
LVRKYWLPALLILAAFVFPIVDNTLETDLMFPMIIVAIYILLALGLNIVVGFGGSWTLASWRSTPWEPT